MTRDALVRESKTLARALRHRPDALGIKLDSEGWTDIEVLLQALAITGPPILRDELDTVVAQNDKSRFAISSDGTRIRASQGHSVSGVKLQLRQVVPPPVLFHRTTRAAMAGIMKKGLMPMTRHHVHLSPDVPTATAVGGRRGPPVILVVDAFRMHRDAHTFYQSDNGVWLVDAVPVAYIKMR